MKANDKKTAAVERSVSMMLRGVAILIVVFSHFTEWMYLPSPYPRITHMISTLGPIGVDIFFVLSGYGLYMSAVRRSASGSPGLRFLMKRLSNVYVPYLMIATVINIFFVGGSMFRDRVVLVNILTGGDYWYIRVLLIFYVFFIIAFALFGRFRLIVLGLLVAAYTFYMYKSGYRDFWTLSNMAFLSGSLTAAFSLKFEKLWSKAGFRFALAAVSLALTLAFCLLMMYYGDSGKPSVYGYEFAANLFFPVFVIFAASFIKEWKPPVLRLLGASSLFQYLLHTILFCNLVGHFEKAGYLGAMFIAAFISMAVACVIHKLYSMLVSVVIKPAVMKLTGGK